ncbi:type I-F CRISPR-associated endoribonuclease Cas6/Csy4 [Gammaproteobacteria bacterium]|nr:type I-F CRISPR-associated endoribonuclease Cas6/Csy4 [Gammaproteobacteria bacterium]
MDHYIDIQLQADSEMPVYFIRNKAFAKFHKALTDLKQQRIGISFPEYKTQLGKVIRIHGSQADLAQLQQSNWLGGLSGYCKVSDIVTVPVKVSGYRSISRIQQNMSNSKLQRLLKRSSIVEQDIAAYTTKMQQNMLDHPYLELKSASNNQNYRRYLKFGDLQDKPRKGKFDFFGFSNHATIPWF